MGPQGAPEGKGYVQGKKVDVQLRTFWVVLAEIATSLHSSGSLRSESGVAAPRIYTNVGGFQQAGCGSQGHMSGCKSCWEKTGICQGQMTLELLGGRWLGVGGGLDEQPCVVGGVVF